MKFLGYLLLGIFCFITEAAELPPSRHNFVVIAHRGDHARAHENTLTALQHAIDAGVDYAEIDVRRTIDGKYVLMHDRTVDRMTTGHGPVDQLTLLQIEAVRVRGPKPRKIPDDRVPTFAEVLSLIKGRLNLYLDFKEGDRAEVANMIRRAGVTQQILVYDGVTSVAEWHRVAPELPLIISPPDELKTPEQLVKFAESQRIEVFDGEWTDYSAEAVAAANRSGVRIWPDIQSAWEAPAYFAKVLSKGFTGAQTDHPEEFIAWLKSRNLR